MIEKYWGRWNCKNKNDDNNSVYELLSSKGTVISIKRVKYKNRNYFVKAKYLWKC